VLVEVLSASASSGATGNMGTAVAAAAAATADGGELTVGVGFRLGREHQPLYRRGGLPLRPRLTEAGTGSKTSASTLGRGRARTDRLASQCAASDERGSSTWRSRLRGRPRCAQCLGKAWYLGRRAAQWRGKRGAGAARMARVVVARRGVGLPDLVSLYPYLNA
jgi:hypothetical protein